MIIQPYKQLQDFTGVRKNTANINRIHRALDEQRKNIKSQMPPTKSLIEHIADFFDSLFNPTKGSKKLHQKLKSNISADKKAIAGDWKAVGDDIKTAIN